MGSGLGGPEATADSQPLSVPHTEHPVTGRSAKVSESWPTPTSPLSFPLAKGCKLLGREAARRNNGQQAGAGVPSAFSGSRLSLLRPEAPAPSVRQG